MSNGDLWLPPGVLCTVPAGLFDGYVCGRCRDPRHPITGIQIPEMAALNTGEISLVFDLTETILPSVGNTLTVSIVHTNPRPAVFCSECYLHLCETFSQPGRGFRLLDLEATP